MAYFFTPTQNISAIVMKLLDNEEKMHGYKLTQEYKQLVAVPVKEGVLYPVLYFLEVDGLLVTETEQVGNRIRKYYRLSLKGKMQRNKKEVTI